MKQAVFNREFLIALIILVPLVCVNGMLLSLLVDQAHLSSSLSHDSFRVGLIVLSLFLARLEYSAVGTLFLKRRDSRDGRLGN